MEEWRDVGGHYKGLYQVSNLGQVRRTDTYKILNQQRHNGYCRVQLWCDNQRYTAAVHRLVGQAFVGAPKNHKLEINHKNGIKDDNRPENLEWVTRRDNLLHAYEVLNRPISCICAEGESNGNAKLTERQVVAIKELLAEGDQSQVDIGKQFGMSGKTINHISTGRRWGHVRAR